MRTHALLTTVVLCCHAPLSVFATEGVPSSFDVDRLVNEVVARHPEIAYYEAEIAAARADGRAARSWAEPEIAVSLGRKSVQLGAESPAREGAAWSVSLSQTFEWPGRQALRRAVADRDLGLAVLALDGFRAELAGRARSLALGLLSGRERARAVEEVAARYRALRETFLAREPGGIAPQLEIRAIEAQELAMARRAAEVQVETDRALIALNVLRGVDPGTPLEVGAGRRTLAETPSPEEMLALALERNITFRTRLAELERQGLRVTLARQENRPAVTVAPFFEEETAGERERTVGLGVSVPLPVTGQARARSDVAQARLTQAEAVVRAARAELVRDVHAAVQAYRIYRDRVRDYPPAVLTEFREAAATADRHYRLGAVGVTTYLELQSAYLEAVESCFALEQAAIEAGLTIESLTGGAWRVMEVKP